MSAGTQDAAPADSLDPGQTSFSDSAIPPLIAGDYQVVVQQTVQVDGQAEPPYGAAQRFRVAGPHLALAPGDVVAQRPTPGTSGDYASWLPHVVLADRTVPWQIPIADPPAGGSGPAMPWLALLLLTREEIDVGGNPPQGAATGAQPVPVSAYLQPPSGTLGPQPTTGLQEIAQEQPDLVCTVVDVQFDAFRATAPASTELPWLAHVRQVDTSDQEELDVPAPGWYSIVVGNRLPAGAADGAYIVHVVSLEGFGGYLPDQPAPASAPGLVRLASLSSWSFTSGADPGDFAQLMQKINTAPFAVPVTISGTDPASQAAAGAVARGYVPLRYATRLGEETTGWYRGPLQPAEPAPNPQPAYPAASSAFVYDPSSGMFDLSYAAAWELGRLLTLANGPVVASLLQWSSGAVQALQLLVERARRVGDGLLPAPATSALAPGAVREAAHRLVSERVIPVLLGRDGTRRPLGAPGDPTGLARVSLPGLLDAQLVEEIVASAADPLTAIVERTLNGDGGPRGGDTRGGARQSARAGRSTARSRSSRRARVPARRPRHQALLEMSRDPEVAAAISAQAGDPPANVSAWLSDLQQLIGVPFAYLVPDARMLEPESVRFFLIDPNWIAALTDGALAVAGSSSPASAATAMLREPALAAAGHASRARRRIPSTSDAEGAAADPTVVSGMLLRSAAVSDWPGLRVSAFADQAGTTPLAILRLERVAPTILFVLFSGLAARVDLSEPAQHLHFGVGSATTPLLPVRWIDTGHAGVQVPGDPDVAVTLRTDPTDPARAVLDLNTTAAAVGQALTTAYAPQPVPHLGAAALALQLLQASQSQSFQVPAPTAKTVRPARSRRRP